MISMISLSSVLNSYFPGSIIPRVFREPFAKEQPTRFLAYRPVKTDDEKSTTSRISATDRAATAGLGRKFVNGVILK